MSEKSDKLRAMLEKEKERRIKLNNRTDRTGTPEYYLSEKQMVDNQHGAAACMMAVSEQLRRA